ncbi:hypothetical protein ACA910_019970 [Epithemia clementina (nom. ined.)]
MKNDNQPRDLIVEGTLASVGDFPWFVSSTGGGYCGGSLVAPSVVLTAAHCSPFYAGGTVLVGATQRSSSYGGAVSRNIVKRIRHPKYNDTSGDFAYDFMLLELDEPVTVEPLAWNRDPSTPESGTNVTVMGFGRTYFGDGPVSSDLLKVDLNIVSDDDCLGLYGRKNLNTDVMICAIGSPGATQSGSACQGDSGGPLVMTATNGDNGSTYPLLVGVVSWGIKCGSNVYPGVYSRPSGAVEWMETTICELSPDCNGYTTAPSPPPTTSFPTISPAPSGPIAPTPAPSQADTCVCLAEPQCLQDLCSRVSNEVVCAALGCVWRDGSIDNNATKPPNVEGSKGGAVNDDQVFQVEDDEPSDLEKAGYSLLVGLAAAAGTFCILAFITSFCCCGRERKQTRRRNDETPSIRRTDYPEIKRRRTDSTNDEPDGL